MIIVYSFVKMIVDTLKKYYKLIWLEIPFICHMYLELLCHVFVYTGCSDTTAQTLTNGNPRSQYMKASKESRL